MRAKKVDGTHNAIVTALRNAGVRVFDSSALGRGFPDLVCSYGGFTALVEAKSERGRIRDTQKSFKRDWLGIVIVAKTGEEAVSEFFKAWGSDLLADRKNLRQIVAAD